MNDYTIRLQDDDTGEVLQLKGPGTDPGVMCPGGVGSPALAVGGRDIRTVVTDRPNGPGTVDTTAWGGAAAVTIDVALGGTAALPAHEFLNTLVLPWLNPSRRPYLYVQRTGWTQEWRIQLRGDQPGPPVVSPGPLIQIQLPFRAPQGDWEAAEESAQVVNIAGGGSGGFHLPMHLPFTLAEGSSGSAQLIDVGGTEDAFPIFRVYGPCSGATKIVLPEFDRQIVFKSSSSIAAGQYTSIDTSKSPRLVLANDDPAVSRLNTIDFSQSTFFTLPPGMTQLSFVPASPGSGCQLSVMWRARRT